MTYSLDIRQARDRAEIERAPGAFVRGFGRVFEGAGVVFLLAAPIAIAQHGVAGLLSAATAATVATGVGRLLRLARRVVTVDGRRRAIEAAWRAGAVVLPVGRLSLALPAAPPATGAAPALQVVRVSSGGGAQSHWLWAVRVAGASGFAAADVVHCDSAADAVRVAQVVADLLALPSPALPGAAPPDDVARRAA